MFELHQIHILCDVCHDTHCPTMECIDRLCPSCSVNTCIGAAHDQACELAENEPRVIWANSSFRIIELNDKGEPEVIRFEEWNRQHGWMFWDEMKTTAALQMANEVIAAVMRKIGG